MDERHLVKLAGRAVGAEYSADKNPLDDDGLALQLAVALGMHVKVDSSDEPEGGSTEVLCSGFTHVVSHHGDARRSTRRAIVLAAAHTQRP